MVTVAELSHAQKRHARLGAVAACASLSSVWIRYEWIANARYHEVGASRREGGKAVRWTRPHASRCKLTARAIHVITTPPTRGLGLILDHNQAVFLSATRLMVPILPCIWLRSRAAVVSMTCLPTAALSLSLAPLSVQTVGTCPHCSPHEH